MVPEMAGMDGQHLWDPPFAHLSLRPLLSAPLPLPTPGGVFPPLASAPLRCHLWAWGAQWGPAVGLLEPSGTGWNQLCPARGSLGLSSQRPLSSAAAPGHRHPVHLKKESDLLLHDPPQLWLEWSLLNFWLWSCEWCSVGESSTSSGATWAQHIHFAVAACRIRACSRQKQDQNLISWFCCITATWLYLCSFVSGLTGVAKHHVSVYSWPLCFCVIREQLPESCHWLCFVPLAAFSTAVITVLCLRATGGDSRDIRVQNQCKLGDVSGSKMTLQ